MRTILNNQPPAPRRDFFLSFFFFFSFLLVLSPLRDLRAVFGRRLEEESGGDLISLLRIKDPFFLAPAFVRG